LPNSNDEHENWRNRGARSNGTAPSARTSGDGVDLDVSWLVPADLSAIDALVRLQVAASRCGRRLQLHGADRALVELLELVGLDDVVNLCRCCDRRGQRGEPPPTEGERGTSGES
jgi:ABC-type transporter Mla MlaB component